MLHNLLNDFQIRSILTEAGTESMAKIATAKVRKQLRLSFFLLCHLSLFGIVRFDNPVKDSVDTVRGQYCVVAWT